MGILLGIGAFLAAAPLFAAVDHTDMVKGPFTKGSDVTKVCLECHDKEASDFIKSSHWKMKGTPNHVKGMEKSTKEYGKDNMTNAFCTTVSGGENGLAREFCFKCHAGYGWTRNDNFDVNDKTRIDCLVCHALKGNYSRGKVGADVDTEAMAKGNMNLELAAQSVGMPNRRTCGTCHFNAGGGDAVKAAGLDSSFEKPTGEHDVHMGTKESGGQDFACHTCHVAKDHRIAGASSMMAHYEARVNCEDCHKGDKAPHKKSKNGVILNSHLSAIACQTCHIPAFARAQATKMSWHWSDVGKDIKAEEQFDRETFDKKKGTFTFAQEVTPVYAWYNGKVERYMLGDKIKDPSKPVIMARPAGSILDKKAKIYPYKYYTGTQPMDSKYRYLSAFQQYGALWVDYNWEKALQGGAKGSGLPYSGKYQFVKTVSYLSVAHEVAPKEQALQCGECHMGGKRLDWKALGYKGDPMKVGGRARK
jgi:octaheme c-type cytochrome (tetrathionate reductase family)